MKYSCITLIFHVVFYWLIFLKPDACVGPFESFQAKPIKAEGIVKFTPNYIEFKFKGEDVKIPLMSVAFAIKG